ncbi:MAG: hypothetical protein JWP25_8992 [Bradyrhizobium sp.]|nr:hypothetical protein [Bradyrhizobium sp.]
MTIENCPNCGGTHFGCTYECPFTKAPCCVCGDPTILACSDCAIDSGGQTSVHVCSKGACRDEHEFFRHKASGAHMTDEQKTWLAANPTHEPVGKPTPGIRFTNVGTLYPDGSFVALRPMEPIKLVAGPPYAIGVGVRWRDPART